MDTHRMCFNVELMKMFFQNLSSNKQSTVGNHVTMLNPIMGASILIFCRPNDGFCLFMR